jgi:hypothetical protein
MHAPDGPREHEPLDARAAERACHKSEVLGEHPLDRRARAVGGPQPGEPVEVDDGIGNGGELQLLSDLDEHRGLADAHGARDEDRSEGHARRHDSVAIVARRCISA